MAQAALRDVSKAPVKAKAGTLAALIDEAGRLAQEKSQLEKAVEKLKQEIESRMDIPGLTEPSEGNGGRVQGNLPVRHRPLRTGERVTQEAPGRFLAARANPGRRS
jgi:hypothetical protein